MDKRTRKHFFEEPGDDAPDPFDAALPDAGADVAAAHGAHFPAAFAAIPPVIVEHLPILRAPPSPDHAPIKLAVPDAPTPLVAAAPATTLTQTQVNAFKAGLDQTLAGIESNL